MTTTFATTPLGRAINTLSRGRLLQTPDQKPGWTLPETWLSNVNSNNEKNTSATVTPMEVDKPLEKQESPSHDSTSTRGPDIMTQKPITLKFSKDPIGDVEDGISGGAKIFRAASRLLPEGRDISRTESVSRAPALRTATPTQDTIIVDWYGPDDPENPKNFTFARKCTVTAAICFMTFSVYGGSSIITPSIPGVCEYYGVSSTKGIMTLSAFVMGYAVGPLLLGPPSDIPKIGRSTPYWISMLGLVLFNVGAAKAESYGTLITCRLLGGIFGSPALATGGATLGDIWEAFALPKAISLWASAGVCGPVLAPVMAGWAAQNISWRLPYWLFVAISGLGLIVSLTLLPETLPANILYRRAKRLRALTGNENLKSQGEIDQAAIKPLQYALDALWMPIRISFEPIVMYSSVLLGLVYAIFYAAFEAVPIVFGEIHGFNLGEQQLPFLGLGVNAFVITLPLYILYLVYYADPKFIKNLEKGVIKPEDRIILSLVTSPLVLISLFWIGWTSRPDISYWSPLLALSLYLTPVFLLFQSVLVYLSFSYVEHQAAVLAANDLIRSLLAAAFPLFANPMFRTLGLGKAYSMLAGISAALLLPLFGLYRYGHVLRRWSKYAHDYQTDIPGN